jgi:hypothetical protein
MTDAEQSRINRAVDRSIFVRSGLEMDKGRRLSAEEIKALEGQITPLHKIPHSHHCERMY